MLGIVADTGDYCWPWGLLKTMKVVADTGIIRYRGLLLSSMIIANAGDYC